MCIRDRCTALCSAPTPRSGHGQGPTFYDLGFLELVKAAAPPPTFQVAKVHPAWFANVACSPCACGGTKYPGLPALPDEHSDSRLPGCAAREVSAAWVSSPSAPSASERGAGCHHRVLGSSGRLSLCNHACLGCTKAWQDPDGGPRCSQPSRRPARARFLAHLYLVCGPGRACCAGKKVVSFHGPKRV